MNVLWLNAGLLLPLDKGGKLRTWHLMRQLARRHHISYLSFADPTATPGDLDGMLDVCRRLDTVPRRDPFHNGFPTRSRSIDRRRTGGACRTCSATGGSMS